MKPGNAAPQGILFDLGNTLLREEHFDVEAGTARVLALARNPRGLSARDVCSLVVDLERDLRRRREESLLEISPFTVHRLVYEPHEISFDLPFQEVEREFWKAATRFSPTPEIAESLSELRKLGVRLGVVSNSTFTSATLAWQLREMRLLDFFRFVMSSADYVVRKPHPAIFQTAVRKLGTSLHETWFVGDSLAYDVVGAHAAGLTSVWYNPTASAPPADTPHHEIRSWPELLTRVRTPESGPARPE
ncbi:MAG: HAD family hydrolase [Myxococcota bacterium]